MVISFLISRKAAKSNRNGFALIVALSLLSFLILLLVSLSVLVRIEAGAAEQALNQQKARANALCGVQVALGQLQRYAGLDQRATARADIDPGNAVNPRWTGVWNTASDDPANPSHAAPPSHARPLVWLVSGSETNGTTLEPDQVIPDPSANEDVVWMVHTVEDSPIPTEEQVKVRVSRINDGSVQLGAYAYWVNDLGSEAPLAVENPLPEPAAGSDNQWRQITSAPAFGLNLIPALGGLWSQAEDEGELARLYVFLENLINLDQLRANPFLAITTEQVTDLVGQVGVMPNWGVLADTLRGGLRRDLTRGLDPDLSLTGTAQAEIGTGVDVLEMPEPGPVGSIAQQNTWTPLEEPPPPTWDVVRSFLKNRANASQTIEPTFAPFTVWSHSDIATSSSHAVMPIITLFELRFGVDIAGSNYNYLLQPTLILCNPYNVNLSEADYSIIYDPRGADAPGAEFKVFNNSKTPLLTLPELNFEEHLGSSTLAFNITDSFGPGQVKIYSLPSDRDFKPTDGGIVDLSPGFSAGLMRMDSGIPIAPALTAEDSVARIEIHDVESYHPILGIAGGHSDVASFAIPSIVVRNLEMESKQMDIKTETFPPYEKQSKPYAWMANATSASHSLITFRHSLNDATNDYLFSGNQPGQHKVPSDHPAYTPWGGTAAELNTGIRMLVDSNPRALIGQRLGGWDNPANYYFESFRDGDYTLPVAVDFVHGFWGGSQEDDGNGASRVILFDVLRDGEELLSLGQLSHVNWGTGSKHPAYPLANSYASIFYPSDGKDFGFALNEALLDRFFFSSLPSNLDEPPAILPNTRLRLYLGGSGGDLSFLEGPESYERAAAHLLIEGAFNVNSTSVEAWSAWLGSVSEMDYGYTDSAGGFRTDRNVRPYPRLRHVHEQNPSIDRDRLYEWSGYRSVEVEQIRLLAEKIVEGIKERGRPSRSIAEFLNRELAAPATSQRNQKGIAQAAIDSVFNQDDPDENGAGKQALKDLPGLIASTASPYDPDAARVVSDDLVNADNPHAARGRLRTTAAPGFLLQSDIFTPLLASMSVRSDTFLIRGYGDYRDRATGETIARVWCEAYVQRLPDFLGGESAETQLDELTTMESRTMGRRFRVTGFRWLPEEEI